ncbi:hypothetical protein BTVI_62467 [Pitangus sulphuratus]|nr:hypothetical protein BTVI_62467 [Pitangus sulphuratus]
MPSCPAADCLGEETDLHVVTTSSQVVVESDEVTPKPPLLQAKRPQLPQPLLTGLVLKSLHQPPLSSLDLFQHLNILPDLRSPELDMVLHVWPHQCSSASSLITLGWIHLLPYTCEDPSGSTNCFLLDYRVAIQLPVSVYSSRSQLS